jgi:addiction module RelE/StbE family toxin
MAAKTREVRWSEAAAQDLGSILEYVARERPLAAREVLDRIRSRAESLAAAAEKGRYVPELERQGIREYRECVISVWRLIYKVTPRTVDVLLLIDSRRNVEDVLLMRLARRR